MICITKFQETFSRDTFYINLKSQCSWSQIVGSISEKDFLSDLFKNSKTSDIPNPSQNMSKLIFL